MSEYSMVWDEDEDGDEDGQPNACVRAWQLQAVLLCLPAAAHSWLAELGLPASEHASAWARTARK